MNVCIYVCMLLWVRPLCCSNSLADENQIKGRWSFIHSKLKEKQRKNNYSNKKVKKIKQQPTCPGHRMTNRQQQATNNRRKTRLTGIQTHSRTQTDDELKSQGTYIYAHITVLLHKAACHGTSSSVQMKAIFEWSIFLYSCN